MDDNTINVDNLFFNIEDEEVNEIDYLEILTMTEIIKNNPSFIAFSKQQIYDELYNIFKSKNKANGFIDLFYNIVENNKKIIDTGNYIIKSDVEKIDHEEEDIDKFTTNIKKINRTQYQLAQNAKNRLFFALSYDDKSDKLRFKADRKTIVQLYKDTEATFYPIYKNDDTNLPIDSIYYKVPTSTIDDYLNMQIISHLYNVENINEREAKFYTKLNKLLKAVKPGIPIDKIEEGEFLDFNHINSLLHRYDLNLDFIKLADFDKLKEHLELLLKNEKEEKTIYNSFKS